MGFFKDLFAVDSPLVKATDPGGVFREDGFLGWDLFGLDHRSEDTVAAAQDEADRSYQAAALQRKKSINKIVKSGTIILIASILLFVFIYSINKGYLTKILNSEI